MITNTSDYLDHIGKLILKLVYPHEHNEHRPFLLRSHGLLVFLLVLIFSQMAVNLTSRNGQVLGFATNISVPEIINLTNNERASSGLVSLKENSALDAAAALKAKDMFEKDYWAHFSPDGTSPWYFFGLVGYKYTWAGENLARDFATSSGVVAAWMASNGHRANILNPNFDEIGVAMLNGNLEGEDTTLVVQFFGKPVSVAAASPTSGQSSSSEAKPTNVQAQLNVPNSAQEKAATGEAKNKAGKPASSNNQLSLGNVLPVNSLVKNMTGSQKVTLSLLAIIFALFVFDSFIIFRRRQHRVGSHSLAHASMILLLIALTLIYGHGAIV